MKQVFLSLPWLLIAGSLSSPAAEPPKSALWNQFRGPNGCGVAEACDPPTHLDVADATWQVSVPPGHSSPVLSRKFIFVTAVDDGRLVTLAFNKQDGALVWRRECPEVRLEQVHEANSPASSTPYFDHDHLYVYFGSWGLLCYNEQGDEQWRMAIPTPRSLYGMSSSPIVYRDSLILVLDNDANLPDSSLSQSRIIAVNKRTGKLIWETARPLQRSSWSTPTVWTHDNTDELVVLGSGRLCGYDLTTGVEKWFVNGFSRETIARPVVGHGFVFASASMLGGVADEQPDPEPFWRAVIQFDSNNDDRLQRDEMTRPFTFPFRPDLPADHPGFGLPLPNDTVRRNERLDAMFSSIDKDKDGSWTKDEFLGSITFDRGKPNLLAVRPGGTGDVTESHVAWALHRGIPEIPSPLYYDDCIYLACDGGIISEVDANDGQVIYRKRLGAAGHYRASPVVANDHLYVISEEGVVSVVKTGDEFELLHQHAFQQRVAATPAIDSSTIYLRTYTHLYAFRK